MWGAWGGQWGADTMLVGGWAETACYPSVMPSLSGTSMHGRKSLSPADVLCSHLDQHPPSSSLPPSNPAFSLQELLSWVLSEPYPTHFGLNNILNILLVQYQNITESVLTQSRTDLGLAVPYFIPKHMRNVPFGFFSACLFLYRRCFITSASLWKMTCTANQSLILWS